MREWTMVTFHCIQARDSQRVNFLKKNSFSKVQISYSRAGWLMWKTILYLLTRCLREKMHFRRYPLSSQGFSSEFNCFSQHNRLKESGTESASLFSGMFSGWSGDISSGLPPFTRSLQVFTFSQHCLREAGLSHVPAAWGSPQSCPSTRTFHWWSDYYKWQRIKHRTLVI